MVEIQALYIYHKCIVITAPLDNILPIWAIYWIPCGCQSLVIFLSVKAAKDSERKNYELIELSQKFHSASEK